MDPKTAGAGAKEYASTLGSSGAGTFHMVDRGAHLLALVPPHCFVAAVDASIGSDVLSEHCAEPAPG